jgi:hypothetical protein
MGDNTQIEKQVIVNIISNILTDTFESGYKRTVLDKGDRLNFACPICGDSQKNDREKRCWLFLGSMKYRCYNEGCHGSLDWLTKKFHIDINPEVRSAIRNITQLSVEKIKQNRIVQTAPKEKVSFSPTEFLAGFPELTNFNFPAISTVRKYLILRGVNPNKFASADLIISEDWVEPVIVILNQSSDGERIIGYQTRNLKKGRQRKYSTHLWSELYTAIKEEEPTEELKNYYDPLSEMYGIMQVDMNQPVTIFEGYMDASIFPNAIGLSGAKTNTQSLIDTGASIRYIFDNDTTGQLAAIQKLKAGQSVFLWKKLIDNLAKQELDPWSFTAWFNNNIVDWGDLIKAGLIDKFNPDMFFSQDQYDIIWFDTEIKKPNNSNTDTKKEHRYKNGKK